MNKRDEKGMKVSCKLNFNGNSKITDIIRISFVSDIFEKIWLVRVNVVIVKNASNSGKLRVTEGIFGPREKKIVSD